MVQELSQPIRIHHLSFWTIHAVEASRPITFWEGSCPQIKKDSICPYSTNIFSKQHSLRLWWVWHWKCPTSWLWCNPGLIFFFVLKIPRFSLWDFIGFGDDLTAESGQLREGLIIWFRFGLLELKQHSSSCLLRDFPRSANVSRSVTSSPAGAINDSLRVTRSPSYSLVSAP